MTGHKCPTVASTKANANMFRRGASSPDLDTFDIGNPSAMFHIELTKRFSSKYFTLSLQSRSFLIVDVTIEPIPDSTGRAYQLWLAGVALDSPAQPKHKRIEAAIENLPGMHAAGGEESFS